MPCLGYDLNVDSVIYMEECIDDAFINSYFQKTCDKR